MADVEYGAALQVGEVKATDSGWTVSGYASTFGNVDEGGDVVMRGAFEQTLTSDRKVRFLYAHRVDQILGKPLELKADDQGLFGTFRISKTQLGEDAHILLKDGALDSFSIGYVPTEVEYDDVGNRLLKTIKLIEVSLVALPMNERAKVTNVKAAWHQAMERLVAVDPEALPFEDVAAQVTGILKMGTSTAEALAARRARDERKLTASHVAAIQSLRAEVKACDARLEELERHARDAVPAEVKAGAGNVALRMSLHQRLRSSHARAYLEMH